MSNQAGFSAGARFLMILAAFIVVVAGLKAAEAIAVTFLLSAFIAIICAAPFSMLRARGLSSWATLSIVVVAVLVAQLVFVSILATSVTEFRVNLPLYQERLQLLNGQLIVWLGQMGLEIPLDVYDNYFNPAALMKLAGTTLTSLGGVLSNATLITLTVIFMLFEGKNLPAKMQLAFEGRVSFSGLDQFVNDVNRYVTIKTVISLITGLLVFVWLWLLNVDFPLLWGLLAFLLNFIPNIGSIIAAVPAVLLALVQLGVGDAVLVAAGYIAVNMVLGNFIEPRYMGRGLGLSTLVVWLSLVFWGWVLGPVGMLLSVPLTMLLKIAFEARAETRWLAILMGEGKPARADMPAARVDVPPA